MNDERVRRTDSVRVKLSPDMLDRVERMAADYGMPAATFCAFAVGDFVRRSEQQAQLGRMAVMDASRRVGDQIGNIGDDKLEKIFGPMIAEITKAITARQVVLPLDQGESGTDSD